MINSTEPSKKLTNSKKDVLLIGQLFTSRTETLEVYFSDRTRNFVVIGFPGIRQNQRGRVTKYFNGIKISESYLPKISVGTSNSGFKIILFFILQSIIISKLILRIRKPFTIAIGISVFPILLCNLAKFLGKVKKTVFYSIDYFPIAKKATFGHKIVQYSFRILDALVFKKSDYVWNLTKVISVDRTQFNIQSKKKQLIVPLTYSQKTLKMLPLNERYRWAIGFIGTLEKLQGLQIVIESLVIVKEKIPTIHLHVIGTGLYEKELKSTVKQLGLENSVTFYGFIKDNEEVKRILSSCSIAVALFEPTSDNPANTADPGKIKLYLFCALPVITTKIVPFHIELEKNRAGCVTEYNRQSISESILNIIVDDEKLQKLQINANRLAKEYTSEKCITSAWEKINQDIYNSC